MTDRFGLVHKSLHWLMAFIILGLLSVGFFMADMEATPQKFQLYFFHKSFGILILILASARLAYRMTVPRPPPLPTHKKWEDVLAKIVHALLYACFIALPLSGWIMSSAGDFPASFFGLFQLPHIVPKDRGIFGQSREIHETLAFVIMGLLALHYAGAFKHHFFDRDATLQRMTYDRLGLGGGLALAVFATLLLAAPLAINLTAEEEDEGVVAEQAGDDAEAAPLAQKTAGGNWTVIPQESHIRVEIMQGGQAFAGEFGKFDADITFDPANLAESHVNVKIDIASFVTGSGDRDAQAHSAEWFNAASFPQAEFTASRFDKTGSNQYVAHGTLKIRGVSRDIDLPFTLDTHAVDDDEKEAEMQAEISLHRLDFGIGQGEWQSTGTIGDAVKVSLYVKAIQENAAPE